MLKATAVFSPFGECGPEILLFGKETGDWNSSCFQAPGNYRDAPGLYARFNRVAEKNNLREIYLPNPSNCNTSICNLKEFTFSVSGGVGSVVLRKGIEADGMVLVGHCGGAIASADCPTIVVHCHPGIIIMAHGGLKSVMSGVVGSIVDKAKTLGLSWLKVFVTCGIAGHNYERLDVASKLPKECLIGRCVDMKKLINLKFGEHGVTSVITDLIDTYDDRDAKGEFLWHSYRRGKTPAEKAGRNLVLVVN